MVFGLGELFVKCVFEIDFPGGDVEHAIVELCVQLWHFTFDEFAILMDGVAGKIDGVLGTEVLINEN
jgi:hypothetical protein